MRKRDLELHTNSDEVAGGRWAFNSQNLNWLQFRSLSEEFTAANRPSAKSFFRTWKEGCLSRLDHCVMTHPFRARERVYVASY